MTSQLTVPAMLLPAMQDAVARGGGTSVAAAVSDVYNAAAKGGFTAVVYAVSAVQSVVAREAGLLMLGPHAWPFGGGNAASSTWVLCRGRH